METTSNTSQVLAYLKAIFFRLSTRRKVYLSRYATKKVKTMSTAKNALTTLSTIASAPTGHSRNPNSKGDAHDV